MSNRYKGGVISATPPTTTGGNDGVASGAWTLEQQMQAQAAGLWPNQPIFYIEDVFSTYLYTGNGSTQTITNGINLSGKGGLVWQKGRSGPQSTGNQYWFDTVRGAYDTISSNNSDASYTRSDSLTSFNSDGFSLGSNIYQNGSGNDLVSWTFREQAKFFDIVTYTGNGAASRNIAHNLGSVPGCIINKALSISENWGVYHRSTGANGLYLNATNTAGVTLVPTGHTSTTFEVADGYGLNNSSGVTYVAYLFAHDAGGFGLTGTDNVISCGSYTGNGSATGPVVTLGYEPQWLMVKRATGTANGNWVMLDVMRGFSASSDNELYANLSAAEGSGLDLAEPQATGFQLKSGSSGVNASGSDYIYIAIRRGPMRVPTVGTSVFAPVTYTGDNSNTRVISTGFPPDMVWTGTPADGGRRVGDRLRGLFTNPGPINATYSTSDEQLSSYSLPQMSGWQTGNGTVRFENSTAVNYVLHAFKRAPSFFDVVCYTGTDTARTITHNLTTAPELIIVKDRSVNRNWYVYASGIGNTKYLNLNNTDAPTTDSTVWNNTSPTSSVFSLGSSSGPNGSGETFVAYLFATCAGVSKVGSYTGTGAAQTINCGFTGGSRFVLIKRTDSTGDWYVWDSARGIIPSNDPYLLLNSTAAEVTGTDYVDTTNVGFDITSTAPAAINANGGTYIFLAIA